MGSEWWALLFNRENQIFRTYLQFITVFLFNTPPQKYVSELHVYNNIVIILLCHGLLNIINLEMGGIR